MNKIFRYLNNLFLQKYIYHFFRKDGIEGPYSEIIDNKILGGYQIEKKLSSFYH